MKLNSYRREVIRTPKAKPAPVVQKQVEKSAINTTIGPILSYKNLLLKVLEKKNKIISDITGVDYINNIDMTYIEHWWSEKDCKKYLEYMSAGSDSDACPWCIRRNDLKGSCSSCVYGSRHGECDDFGSLYYKIRSLAGCAIVQMGGIEELYELKDEILNNLEELEYL